MATASERRTRAEAVVETLHATTQTGTGSPNDDEQAAALAERLDIPVGLVWLAVDGMTVEQIDQLVGWWPRGEA